MATASIGTGNGAIPALAVELARDRGLQFELHGIDAVPIRPLETVRWHRELIEPVHFHGGIRAESTPFPDGYFHALCAQFAFEYTDQRASARELGRLAAPGAALMFVVHHPDSVIVATSAPKRAHARLVLVETRFFEEVLALVERIGEVRAQGRSLALDAKAERMRCELNQAAERIVESARSARHPDILHWSLDAFRFAWRKARAGDVEEASRVLEAGRNGVHACLERLDDLAGAGLGQPALEASLEYLDAAGFDVTPPERFTLASGALIGWVVIAHRRSD